MGHSHTQAFNEASPTGTPPYRTIKGRPFLRDPILHPTLVLLLLKPLPIVQARPQTMGPLRTSTRYTVAAPIYLSPLLSGNRPLSAKAPTLAPPLTGHAHRGHSPALMSGPPLSLNSGSLWPPHPAPPLQHRPAPRLSR